MEDGSGCLLFAVLILGGAIALYWWQSSRRRAALNAAWSSYQQSLAELKRRPNDPEIKQKALGWGRHYSALTRQHKAATLYDEVALMNDISAATAGANAASFVSSSPEERLDRLRKLKDQGLISDEEFTERRKQILSEI